METKIGKKNESDQNACDFLKAGDRSPVEHIHLLQNIYVKMYSFLWETPSS